MESFPDPTDLSEGETLNIGGYVISRSEGKVVGDRSAVLEGCDEVRTVGATPVIEGAAQLDILVNDHLIEIFVNDGQYVLSHVVYGKSKKIPENMKKFWWENKKDGILIKEIYN